LFSFLINSIIIFFNNLAILLLLTIVIATITLIERKVLALVQRRVGPNYIGYRGRLQFIADAIKLLAKQINVILKLNKITFLILPPLVLITCYLFWVNIIWGPNLAICDFEYNLIFMGLLSSLFSMLLFLVGWETKNKYAVLSSNRVLVTILNLEIFLNFLIVYLIMLFESFSFLQASSFQYNITIAIFMLLPISPALFIIFLLETARIPFDLSEAESELISGYTTEMGGFFFALFYLGEYFHLFCFSVIYTLCLFGGWTFVVIKKLNTKYAYLKFAYYYFLYYYYCKHCYYVYSKNKYTSKSFLFFNTIINSQ
jgi:NADH:ubiquinone oxidoreductase subunit H